MINMKLVINLSLLFIIVTSSILAQQPIIEIDMEYDKNLQTLKDTFCEDETVNELSSTFWANYCHFFIRFNQYPVDIDNDGYLTITGRIKDIFKTAIEIDQMHLVEQAADRQEFLCQGQSLNLFFPAGADKKELHRSQFAAWKLGTKGLYYLRTETTQRAENVSSKVARYQLKDFETQTIEAQSQDECVACQG